MEDTSVCFELNDVNTSDVTVCLKKDEEKTELFYAHSSILQEKSKYFADKLSDPNCGGVIDIHCLDVDYEHHVDLLKSLYLSEDSLLESWKSVHSALGVLQLAIKFNCEEITESCVHYLEAVPWEDKEEDLILKIVPKLGPVAMPILARVQPVDLSATKSVFISAVRFATSLVSPSPPFGDELKTSAQEQVEYMLGDDDEEIPLVIADEEVKAESKKGLMNIFSLFDKDLSCLLSQTDDESAEKRVMQSLSDLSWICNVLSKMDLMKEFVDKWIDFMSRVIGVMEDKLLKSSMWGLKLKIIELNWKVLDAVGYGNVIIPPARRVELVKTWLPFIRKLKPILDSIGNEETGYPYKMDDDLCQNIEGAIVALLSALPSNDQADILADWMNGEQTKYPDLSEAFEIWCYRTKSAKRRLVEGLDRVDKATVSLKYRASTSSTTADDHRARFVKIFHEVTTSRQRFLEKLCVIERQKMIIERQKMIIKYWKLVFMNISHMKKKAQAKHRRICARLKVEFNISDPLELNISDPLEPEYDED